MKLDVYSRFNLAPVVRVVDAKGRLLEPLHLGYRAPITVTDAADNTTYRPARGDRWAGIAYRLLGDALYYYAIADCSGVLDLLSLNETTTFYSYVAQLTESVTAGEVTSAKLSKVRGIDNNTTLRIEDLDTSGSAVEVQVVSVDKNSKTVSFFAKNFPVNISAARSKVSRASSKDVVLTVPSAHRFRMDIADFGNKVNVVESV